MPAGEAIDLQLERPSPAGPPPDSPPAREVPDGSPLGALRKRYQALQSGLTKDLDVPGYGGALVARYRVIGQDRYEASRRDVAKVPVADRGEILGATIQLVEACDSLWCRAEEGHLVSLVDGSPDGPPVRYGDDELAAALGFDPSDTARGNIRKVFTVDGDLNVTALLAHSIELSEWMQNVSQEADTAFAGE